MNRLLLIPLLVSSVTFSIEGQVNNNKSDFVANIKKTDAAIVIDGVLDEKGWEVAQVLKNFQKNFPDDDQKATFETIVRLTYDDNYLYIGAEMYGQSPGDYTVSSLKRDFGFFENDNFIIYLDTFLDETSGFLFGITPLGVIREGLLFRGFQSTLDWDNVWSAEVSREENRWVAEIRLPFKTLRYEAGNDQWNINFVRNDQTNNELSTWAAVPRQFQVSSLAYAGRLQWDTPPPKPGANISLIPYLSGGTLKDFEAGTPSEGSMDFGLDAKIAVTSGLTLDLTVNPDFSQVEVDRQITNLSRFELFFPERRKFFLENEDLFADYGFSSIRPFFSRRVGLGVPILGGARLTGKLNNNWRLGLINIQTDADQVGDEGIPAQNYTVATIQRQVFKQSTIGLIAVNKEQFDFSETDSTDAFTGNGDLYNRLLGLEYNLRTADNGWRGKTFYFRSFSNGSDEQQYAHATFLQRSYRHWELEWNHELVGRQFNAEVGFVPRKGYARIEPSVIFRVFPENDDVNQLLWRVGYSRFFNTSGSTTDEDINLSFNLNFANTSSIQTNTRMSFVKLLSPFDPSRTGGQELPTGNEQRWNTYSIAYRSDRRKLFNYNASLQYGGFFNGERIRFTGEVNYRFQPFGSISVSADYNDLDLPEGFNDTRFWLIGPRVDLTFTDKLFLTTFVQYNEQADNVNLNARFQWRFKPVSDLFVVYTENYLPEDFASKNRALVLKLTYWLNL